MKKVGFLISILALVFSTLPAAAAQTVSVSVGIEDDLIGVYESGITKVGWIGSRNGLPYFDGNVSCASFTDNQCLKLSGVGIVGTTVLPLCAEELDTNCIEAPRIKNSLGMNEVAQFVGNADGFTFPADVANGISKGSTSSVFSIKNKDNTQRYFAATAIIKQLKARKSSGGFSDIQIPLFSLDIKEISLDLTSNCLFIFKKSCASQKSSEIFDAELTVRLSSNPPKWLAGRIASPKVKFTDFSNGKKITVSGTSVSIPIAEGAIPTAIFSKYPRGIPLNSVAAAAENGTKLVIDPGMAIMYASDVFAALNEKSIRTANYWNINGSSPITAFCAEDLQVDCLQGGNGPCVENSKDFVGLIATNALIFSRNPPKMIDDEIQFLLASPHYLPDSKEVVGNFSLEASSSMLRCIYGLPDLPLYAEITVVNDAGVEKVATKSFSEKNGISYVSVNNFTFSLPKIRIKLSTAKKPLSITCVKGKVKKAISGTKPVCPKGYKKIA
jgi:hypothetical protein